MNSKHRFRRFSQRDKAIIEHTARYRLTTKAILHRLFFEQNEPNAVTKVIKRMCEEHWLKKYALIYPAQYLIPGRRTAQVLGLPIARTAPLGPQSLPTEFAVLQYAAGSPSIQRMTSEEFSSRLPWYREEWRTATHCLREDAPDPVIELVRVDLGGPADHIARKCQADLHVRTRAPEFERLVAQSRFCLVVLTATSDKARAIQLAIQSRVWPNGLRFHVAIVLELLPLLPNCFDV